MRITNRTGPYRRCTAPLRSLQRLVLSACSSDAEETVVDEPAPAAPAEPEAPAEDDTDDRGAGTIVDVAVATDGFETLVAALRGRWPGRDPPGEGPFTVFAPTDEAFAALPEGLLEKLLLPENSALLVKILTYHVVAGEVLAADVVAGEVATVEGQNVTLDTANGVTVNGANVTLADVLASNGVIHVIDAVILPPDVDVSTL
jgi:uncharacterized surface protein with fasciclin (FAS1) repeats